MEDMNIEVELKDSRQRVEDDLFRANSYLSDPFFNNYELITNLNRISIKENTLNGEITLSVLRKDA